MSIIPKNTEYKITKILKVSDTENFISRIEEARVHSHTKSVFDSKAHH